MRRAGAWFAALALAMLLPPSAQAGVALGVRAGVSISSLTGDANLPPDSKLGLGGGLFATFGINDLLSLQPELLYVSKGASFGESDETDENGIVVGTFNSFVSVDYLEVPVLLRVALPLGGTIRPVLVLGPSFGLELKESFDVSGSSNDVSIDTENLKSFDVGAAVGLGFELVGGGGIWSLEARSTFGLTNLDESALGYDGVHNRDFLISVGFARSIR